MELRPRFCLGEPPGRHRDSYEQQPDQRASHTAARHEEVMDALGYHLMILAAANQLVSTGQALVPGSLRHSTRGPGHDGGNEKPPELPVLIFRRACLTGCVSDVA